MSKDALTLIQALTEELEYRREYYEATEREEGAQYGLARAITIIEREASK